MGAIYEITRFGGKGVGFLGAEIKEAWPTGLGVLLGLMLNNTWGWQATVILPVVAFYMNKAYIDWKKDKLPDFVHCWLYARGWLGYSRAFSRPNQLFIGDAVAGCARSHGTLLRKSKWN
jgi:hypothetical protein